QRSLQGRDHPSARTMAVIRSRRVRDAGMGGLVQQSAALGADRQHPAGRSRGTLLRHAGTTCQGSVTQTKWPPTNPGRFTCWACDGTAAATSAKIAVASSVLFMANLPGLQPRVP